MQETAPRTLSALEGLAPVLIAQLLLFHDSIRTLVGPPDSSIQPTVIQLFPFEQETESIDRIPVVVVCIGSMVHNVPFQVAERKLSNCVTGSNIIPTALQYERPTHETEFSAASEFGSGLGRIDHATPSHDSINV